MLWQFLEQDGLSVFVDILQHTDEKAHIHTATLVHNLAKDWHIRERIKQKTNLVVGLERLAKLSDFIEVQTACNAAL